MHILVNRPDGVYIEAPEDPVPGSKTRKVFLSWADIVLLDQERREFQLTQEQARKSRQKKR